jgi:hypothetical protein
MSSNNIKCNTTLNTKNSVVGVLYHAQILRLLEVTIF